MVAVIVVVQRYFFPSFGEHAGKVYALAWVVENDEISMHVTMVI